MKRCCGWLLIYLSPGMLCSARHLPRSRGAGPSDCASDLAAYCNRITPTSLPTVSAADWPLTSWGPVTPIAVRESSAINSGLWRRATTERLGLAGPLCHPHLSFHSSVVTSVRSLIPCFHCLHESSGFSAPLSVGLEGRRPLKAERGKETDSPLRASKRNRPY